MNWIKAALQDKNSELYKGWDKQQKRYDGNRRVAIVMGNYVVVIALIGDSKANFVTAYVADTSRTLEKIKGGPKWQKLGA